MATENKGDKARLLRRAEALVIERDAADIRMREALNDLDIEGAKKYLTDKKSLDSRLDRIYRRLAAL